LNALAHLGVLVPEEGCAPLRGIRFVNGSYSMDSPFGKDDHGLRDHGLGVRRTLLHRLLAERATLAGVETMWGARVTGISNGRVLVNGEAVEARWIIGADGIASRIRTWAGLDASRRETRRFGFRRHYRILPWTDRVEIHWGGGYQIYITPVGPEEICLALISRDPHLRIDEALGKMPGLLDRLAGAQVSSTDRGSVIASRRLARVSKGNIALIGDASGSVDAITGQGLCLGFLQAISLARAVVAEDLSHYEADHRRMRRRPAFMAQLMLTLGESPRLRMRATRVLASNPGLFARMLALHIGELHPARFAAAGFTLGARMLFGSFREAKCE
jgi:2-polyprenyl-6-methoxyphenol hydroxylase-like FAD-dependent oxidoreductase